MTDIRTIDDEIETTNSLWAIIDMLTKRGQGLIEQAMDSETGYVVFQSHSFNQLSANDRNFVLQRVRGRLLEQKRRPHRLFWVPERACFAVGVHQPVEPTDHETDTDLETIPSVYRYIRDEITRQGGSFAHGGVLQLRDVVEDGNNERFEYIARQLDGATREVGDGSNATFTLKWHQSAQQIEVRISGHPVPN
jgi:hypothetical protein